MCYAQAVVIRDSLYYGGGVSTITGSVALAVFNYFSSAAAAAATAEYRVFCYSPSEDTWNTLPACDVRRFGLSQVRGKLVTVGGRKKSDGKLKTNVTNEVYEFDEATQSWKQSILPMPTSRYAPAVLSHHSTLIVAGGYIATPHSTRTTAVELFREETSQWYTTDPLPSPWSNSTSALINNRWYLIGEKVVTFQQADGSIVCYSNPAVCAHIDLLFQKAVPRDQAAADSNSTNKPAWEVLPNTPQYKQTAAHIYSPCNNAWIHIGDLSAWDATATMLSPMEVLVIGGWNRHGIKNSVNKGILQIE